MPNGRHGARAAPSKPLPSHGGLGPCLPPTPGPHLCTSGARQKKYHATGLEYRAFVLSVTDAMYLTERERATMGKEEPQHGFRDCCCGWLGSGPEGEWGQPYEGARERAWGRTVDRRVRKQGAAAHFVYASLYLAIVASS